MKPIEAGYLRELFRVFELSGAPKGEVPPHYHEFRKLVILLEGSIGYMVENNRYALRPGSIVLVEAGKIHRPLVRPGEAYERIIVYLSPELFRRQPALGACFERAQERESWLLDPGPESWRDLERRAHAMTDSACARSAFPNDLQGYRLGELLILLGDCSEKLYVSGKGDPSEGRVSAEAVRFITAHLKEELSVERVSDALHVSRSYLMHAFRADTGCTVGEYITEKRLYYASACLQRGMTLTEAAAESGFGAYSTFYRAWQKRFGASPRKDRDRLPPVLE